MSETAYSMRCRYLTLNEVHHISIIIFINISIADSFEKGLFPGIRLEFVIMFEQFHGLEITIVRHLRISDDAALGLY